MKKIICYSLMFLLVITLSLFINIKTSDKIEVHASGPKIFEVGDVLPATTQLRVHFNGGVDAIVDSGYLTSDSNNFYFIVEERPQIFAFRDGEIYFEIVNYDEEIWISPFNGTTHNYMDIDTSSWSLSKRTISSVGDCPFTWEDLAPAPSGYTITFEENGGTTISDIEEASELPDPLPIPSKENHTFLGWYYDSSLTIRAFPGDPLTDDIVLYAKWGSGKVFEVADVLPQGIIRVSWDETTWYKMADVFGQPVSGNQIKSSNNSFNFIEKIGTNYYVGGIPVLYIPEPGNLEFYPPYTVFGEGHAYVDINTAGWDLAKRTITTVIWSENLTSRLYWEDITPDGYTQGYQTAKEYYGWEDGGYWYTGEEAWDMGNEYARGIYGYYDPITKQWLSVSEYLELYGTDKMSQTDFYNNFDKYFIPAMIIVFGGAIVLTILKVFKGRE